MNAPSAYRIKDCLQDFLVHPFSQFKNILQLTRNTLRIARSGLFDRDWYLNRYKDIADADIDPLIHYVRRGAYEGRNPNPLFCSDWYLKQNPAVADAGENPLVHYIRYGENSKRNPSVYFNTDWYVSQHEDVKKSGMHPLRHYLKIGAARGMRPIPTESALRRWIIKVPDENLPKILMIDQRYPRPNQDSGSIDCINYIRIFQELGYQVFFASDEEYNIESTIFKMLEDQNVLCLNPADYLTIDKFIELEIAGFSAVFLSRVFSGGLYYELIRRKNREVKIIFNPVDIHSIREEREAQIKNDPGKIQRAFKTGEREKYLTGQCDATIVVSEYEYKYLSAEIPGARLEHIPLMRECPGRERDFSDRSGICFIGSYQHSPNIDALMYFIDNIWPLILEKLPDCKFYILGSCLTEEITRMESPDIKIIGYVPDPRDWMDRMRLSVAPLRYGAGAKGKVVTSLANGLPCVATDIAVEGMGLVKDLHIAVENNRVSFADSVIRIYGDRNIWTMLSNAGWRYCVDNFSYYTGRNRVAGLFRDLDLPVVRI